MKVALIPCMKNTLTSKLENFRCSFSQVFGKVIWKESNKWIGRPLEALCHCSLTFGKDPNRLLQPNKLTYVVTSPAIIFHIIRFLD